MRVVEIANERAITYLMSVWRRIRGWTAIVTIALILAVRLVGAAHAADYSDPYHTHHGEPCLIKVVLESAPSDLGDAPRFSRQKTSHVRYVPDPRVLTTNGARRAHTIRGPPNTSI